MDKQGFERLLRHLGDAWEQGNAEAAALLFTPDAVYAEMPYDRTIMGSEAIRLHFRETAKEERNPSFIVHKTIFSGDEGVVEWTYMYDQTSTGHHRVQRGVALVELVGDKFKSWREYSQSASVAAR